MIKNSIVLVPFPFDDFSASKVRPALCLTAEIGRFRHVIIAFISSRTPDDLQESDLVIRKDSPEWIDTGLAVDSVIQADGRIRKWVKIVEEGKVLRVILLPDGQTVHNAFFDRSFKEVEDAD